MVNALKIAFDVQLLLKGYRTGIGWCADNILKQLPHNNDVVYQLNCFANELQNERVADTAKYTSLGYQLKTCSFLNGSLYRLISSHIYLPYHLFFGRDSDITVFFNYIVPPGVKGKKVVFIHDMAFKVHPETVRRRTKYVLNLALKKSCKRADHIITVSQFSKKEIIKYLNVPEDKISVMYNGVDLSLYHPNYMDEDIQRVKRKYNIQNNYFLYLGTLEPRKNLERLIEAYGLLIKEMPNCPVLVLAGGNGWLYNNIYKMVNLMHLEKYVFFTGYVKQVDVPLLMKGAFAFLFPSVYEGFGMPPLEAMACGTPVLVSNTASLPEIVGEAGVQVDPYSVASIKEGMKLLIENDELRNELSSRGIIRAQRFTWDSSVSVLLSVFEKLK